MTSLAVLAVVACLAGSALYSGGETAVYSLSRLRLEGDAGRGLRAARLLRSMLARETTLLVTILAGNNLMVELGSRLGEHLARGAGVPPAATEVAVTAALTPLWFLLAELLPKDLFRRRPHALAGLYAPFLYASSLVFLPLALPLSALVAGLERLLGVRGAARDPAAGRGAFDQILYEGREAGAIPPEAGRLLENVLGLARTEVRGVMVPWERVETVGAPADDSAVRAAVEASAFSRLPWQEPGGAVRGYVLQLEVLGAPERPVRELLRPLPELPPATPIDRALRLMRTHGVRAALVGTAQEPLGLVTLKDLVEEISGELSRW